jgi:peptidoglycan/LPS O-acetylase OafA/YrhL
MPTFGFTVIGLSCAALVAMTLRPRSITQRVFENNILRFYGKYSYGLYVYHYSVNGFLSAPARAFANNHLHSKGLGVLAGACLVMAVTVPIAVLSYHFYEAPFLKLKRFFSYNRPAPVQSAQHHEKLSA